VDDSTGFASQHACTNVENSLYFMSGEGKIYQVPSERGPVAQERSPQLEGTLKRLFTKRLEDTELAYIEHDRKVVAAVTLDENSHHTHVLVSDLTSGGWTLSDAQVESFGEFRDSDGRGRMCFGNVRGDIGQFGVGSGYGAQSGLLTGTITGATKNTLTIDLAPYWSTLSGYPVHLFDSKWNLVQTNMISREETPTRIACVFSWDVVPDATNNTWYYVIGGCFPEWKFGWMDSDAWATLNYIQIGYVPSYGKLGVYHETEAESDRLVGTVDFSSNRGLEKVFVMRGCKRFRTTLRFFEGAAPNKIVSVEWDYTKTEASW
jgi:hypothetical protein